VSPVAGLQDRPLPFGPRSTMRAADPAEVAQAAVLDNASFGCEMSSCDFDSYEFAVAIASKALYPDRKS
jgi:hypothetical protein